MPLAKNNSCSSHTKSHYCLNENPQNIYLFMRINREPSLSDSELDGLNDLDLTLRTQDFLCISVSNAAALSRRFHSI